jgi:hypothetical protein
VDYPVSEIGEGPMQEREELPPEDKAEGIIEALVAAVESQRSGWSISDPRLLVKQMCSRTSMFSCGCACA